MADTQVVVVGGGLAGLSCAHELASEGVEVVLLEARDVVGGRTSSWTEDGMPVESGLHRFLGLGGMTDVMCAPIARAVERAGGEVRTGVGVDRLVMEGSRVAGVVAGGETIGARHVVVATSISPAQELLQPHVGDHPWFAPMLALPSTPSVTLQIKLDGPVTDVDRTTFGPGTPLACFAEQSRTTFRHAPGRLSLILSPPERFLEMDPADVLSIVCAEGRRVGLDLEGHVTGCRLVPLPRDFHSLEPGHLAFRPGRETPVPGLALAGDYTRQRFVATMEGAVISGRKAAVAVQSDLAASGGG